MALGASLMGYLTLTTIEQSGEAKGRLLGELTRQELAEVITDAWACRAPRRLVREHRGDG